MAYIAAEDILKAKEMDLMTYLRNYEPQELVHVSGNTYCTREHDSLRISNGKWYWFSQDIGGRSALDYLIKVKGLSCTVPTATVSSTSWGSSFFSPLFLFSFLSFLSFLKTIKELN